MFSFQSPEKTAIRVQKAATTAVSRHRGAHRRDHRGDREQADDHDHGAGERRRSARSPVAISIAASAGAEISSRLASVGGGFTSSRSRAIESS